MASVRAGTQWGGWMKMQEKLRKKMPELQRKLKSWLSMERGVRAAPLLPMCVIWQYHSDQILLFCAQLQVTHGRGASELQQAAHRDNHFWGYTKTSMTRRWWEVTLLDSALQLHPALGPHHRNDVNLLE